MEITFKKSSVNKGGFWSKSFIAHVQQFMDSMQLINPHKKALVAVSGGVDSIALMHVLALIFKGQLRVLHINHGTRAENDIEEQLVLEHCQQLGLEIDVVRFQLNLDQSNFEAVARNLRAQVYKQYIQKKYLVYTAHHLDDSFEWSMIQSFKQSSVASTLGIPVFNRGLVRPFMCASKNQIMTFAKIEKLKWASDSSNRDTRFERNFFRQNLTQIIHKRYPQYLRHYVARQNQLALQLKRHRQQFLKKDQKVSGKLEEKRELSGAVVLISRNFNFHKHQVKEWIHFFSKSHRGEIDHELDKLILAHQKIVSDPKELKMKGPLSFSGGVKVFILDECILICNELHLEYYRQCDDFLMELFKSKKIAQITDSLSKQKGPLFFPYLTLVKDGKSLKSSKLVHPLLPKCTSWLKTNHIPYTFYPLLSTKVRQSALHNAVILDSSVLGL